MTQTGSKQDSRSRLVQVFRYLQALNHLRNPVQREINDQPWVMYFHDLPNHPFIRRGNIQATTSGDEEDETGRDDFILKVRRPRLTEPPEPPKEIVPWLQNGWQQPGGKVIVQDTIETIYNGQPRISYFRDDARRVHLLQDWQTHRDTWAKPEQIIRATFAIFEKLYALQSQLEREGERLELMLGDGLLNWTTKNIISIHHPILLMHLQLQFNPQIPEFTLTDTGQAAEFYTALLQTIPEASASDIARSRKDFEQAGYHPLGGEETKRFLIRFVNQLSSGGQFIEQGQSASQIPASAPRMSRDPVIFLRPRTLGISTALEAILETLPTSPTLPFALTSLTNIEGISNTAPGISTSTSTITSPNGEDEQILLSKPANAEQLEIAKILERKGAVLVQGPPGTGKTHTIANLIGHLLAQGKNILVTSEKPKALRVLREQVVEPLQPLCVSILSDDSRKQMENTIDAISERLSYINADKLEREATQLSKQRLDILRQLAETRKKLIEARSNEYRPITLAGTTFSPAEAARLVASHKKTANWIPEPITPGAALPLSNDELHFLFSSNTTISAKDERELAFLLPEIGKLIPPVDFARIASEQAQLAMSAKTWRPELWRGSGSIEAFQELYSRLEKELAPLPTLPRWQMEAIVASYEGGLRRQVWAELIDAIEQTYQLAAQAQLYFLRYNLEIPQNLLPDRIDAILEEICEYLSTGGKLSSLKLFTKRDWKTLIESTRVNGKPPTEREHFEALRYMVQLQRGRAALASRWQRQMVVLGEPDATTFGSDPERGLYQYVPQLRRCIDWYIKTWIPLENELKTQGFQWELFLSEIPLTWNQYGNFWRLYIAFVEKLPPVITAELQRATHLINAAKLQEMAQNLQQISGKTAKADVVQRLSTAIAALDADAYSKAYAGLADLHAKREIFVRRQTLLTTLERVAPGWAAAIRARSGVHGQTSLPGNPQEAWLWRQMNDELDRRASMSLEELQNRNAQLSQELLRITAELVEKKAWTQQARHTTLEQQRALQGWRQLMRKVGKGTGKRAPQLLREARTLMPVCQTAIPVWIMPLSYVARNFDMKRNQFDVVIIDEASQADITALIAVYLGKQVIIVGDHEQVSPMAVGQKLDEVQHLIDEHLKGIPLAQMYDGKLSIYDLAKTTFQMICLLEHFRCVSPIIQFSNDLSYSGKIKPLRDDSEVQRRPPTITYHVAGSSKNGKVNEVEAFTVASLLIAASELPEYKDATFGVISMVGSEQALYIETLLRRYMEAKEFVERRVLCGDPAQFQGDERDVMFLSMVDVPNEAGGPLPMRAEEGHDDMFKKRFNVAASRARDQMWVVHSLDPDTDLKPGDIRRRLIMHARDQHQQQRLVKEQEKKVESEFERQVFERLVRAGYRVTTQWPVGAYRIDMVVEGNGKRLAVECDGDRWHTQENLEDDMVRQAILERLGWRFARIRGSQFFRDPEQAMELVFARLRLLGIPAEGMVTKHDEQHDGSELQARIVRRADELRHEWEKLGNQPAFQDTVAPAARQNEYRRRKEAASSVNISPIPQPPSSRIAAAKPAVTTASSAKPASPVGNARPQDNKVAVSNPILFLQMKGHKVIDNRENRGGIWVVGGLELAPVMNLLIDQGFLFRFVPRGLPRPGGQPKEFIDGWFLKSL